MKRLLCTLALMVPTLLISGCSGSIAAPATDPSPAAVATAAAPSAPSPEDLAAYFGAIAGESPTEQRAAAENFAAPGSNAYAYAIEQSAVNQAYQDAGVASSPPSKIKTLSDGFEVCSTNTLTQDETCNIFDEFQYVDGRLADFDAGGIPLAGRLSLGDGSTVPLGDIATAK